MADPLTCYKYCSGAAALRCLSEGTAYFASPRGLNDSLEATFDVAGPEQYAAVIEKTLSELSLRRGGPPFAVDDRAAEDIRVASTEETERFVSACQQVGIFSGAPRPDNQPMWADYCGNEQGVCFHLEWSKDIIETYHLFPTEVVYSRETRLLNRADDVRQALLEVAKQNPTWSLDQLKAFSLSEPFLRRVGIRGVARAVSIKHADWEHEREVRMLAPRSGPLPLMQNILKSVIYTRTDFPEWGSIVMLLHQLYPKVRHAKMAFSHREPFVTSQLLTTKKVPFEVDPDPWWRPAK
ncbi:MAG: DUF2971 domain-containing protein [Deltaproteobacteria bacterium]|nr:MAG: DUF2971 domain-containing protein [Deltaproteobacteria bacterium]